MRFARILQLLTVLLSITFLSVFAAKMETNEVEQTNNAMEEQVAGGVAEVDEPKLKARKPRIGITGGRQTWVDCVGMTGDEVVDMIKTERPDLRKVVIVREGSMVTMDIRMDRVRVFVNADNVVTRPPRVG